MNVRWQKGLAEIAIWLTAEIILNFLGLDNLADYSEFIFKHKGATSSSLLPPVVVMRVI
jgi:hypothetical protein